MSLRIVSSSRGPMEGTRLHRSVERLRNLQPLNLAYLECNDGTIGLGQFYSDVIHQAEDEETLVFVHDDVEFIDLDLEATLSDALTHFDIIGVAGGKYREPDQPSWSGNPYDISNSAKAGRLSGHVQHDVDGKTISSMYGPAPQTVKMIDGVFIAAKAGVLRNAGVSFDPQFKFHFYDLDFCRSAEVGGLTIGTWFIPLIHAPISNGFDSPAWEAARKVYFKKWGE